MEDTPGLRSLVSSLFRGCRTSSAHDRVDEPRHIVPWVVRPLFFLGADRCPNRETPGTESPPKVVTPLSATWSRTKVLLGRGSPARSHSSGGLFSCQNNQKTRFVGGLSGTYKSLTGFLSRSSCAELVNDYISRSSRSASSARVFFARSDSLSTGSSGSLSTTSSFSTDSVTSG